MAEGPGQRWVEQRNTLVARQSPFCSWAVSLGKPVANFPVSSLLQDLHLLSTAVSSNYKANGRLGIGVGNGCCQKGSLEQSCHVLLHDTTTCPLCA